MGVIAMLKISVILLLCGIAAFRCAAEYKLPEGTYKISDKGIENAEFMRNSAMFYYYIKQKNHNKAVEYLQRILEKKPNSPYLLYWTVRLYRDGLFPEEKMIEIAKRHEDIPLLCGTFAEVLAGKGKKAVALELVEKSLAYYLDPPSENEPPRGKKQAKITKEFQLLLCTYLDFMIRDKTFSKGEPQLKKVRSIYSFQDMSDSTLIRLIEYSFLADSAEKKHSHKDIRKQCSEILKKRLSGANEFRQEVSKELILMLLEENEGELVESLLMESLLTDPYFQGTYRNLLISYAAHDQSHNMIRALSREILLYAMKEKRLPGSRIALLVLTAISVDDEKTVLSQLKHLEKFGSFNDDFCYKISYYFVTKGNIALAKRFSLKIKNPVMKKLANALILRQEKQYKRSLAIFLELERMFPQNSLYKMFAAETAKEAGDKEIEHQFLNEMLMKSKGNAQFQNFVGYTWAERGINLDRAEQLLLSALKVSPNDYAYLDSMAWIAYKKGDYVRAKKYILEALKHSKPNMDVGLLLDHAGDIFAALKDHRNAMKYWQKAVQSGDVDLDKEAILKKLPRPTFELIKPVQNPEPAVNDPKNEPAEPEKKPSLPKGNKG